VENVAFNIKDPETDRLARALAAATGESLTDAIRIALRDRLERETRRGRKGIAAEIRRIQERLARLPVLDQRAADEIIGYDERGLPG
jgi:antitoxin VapB